MIIPLNKLMAIETNRYIFTRAAMIAVDKIENIRDFTEEDNKWKVVPHVLGMVLDDKVQFKYTVPEEEIAID